MTVTIFLFYSLCIGSPTGLLVTKMSAGYPDVSQVIVSIFSFYFSPWLRNHLLIVFSHCWCFGVSWRLRFTWSCFFWVPLCFLGYISVGEWPMVCLLTHWWSCKIPFSSGPSGDPECKWCLWAHTGIFCQLHHGHEHPTEIMISPGHPQQVVVFLATLGYPVSPPVSLCPFWFS